MTLVNCKIRNYPLGEPDNQNPANNIALNSSVNLNTLPSHVKLVVKPDNDPEPAGGYYGIRAEDFHIGGMENFLNQNPNEYVGYFQGDDATSGTFPSMIYPLVASRYFDEYNTSYDTASSIETLTSGFDDTSVGQEYYGLGYSPLAVQRNQLSEVTFGEIGSYNRPGRVYHFHGRDTDNPIFSFGQNSAFTSEYPVIGLFPDFNTTYVSVTTGGTTTSRHLKQFYSEIFPPDTDISTITNSSEALLANENKGLIYTTSWRYINRIMICNSLDFLPSNLDDPEAYPIDNEVHVWVEFKDNYILYDTPTGNPELWDIKVDIDGAAKFIET